MKRLRVNPILCDGYGYCAELFPERFRLDDWGFPVISDADIPDDLVNLARKTVAECPRKAILLEDSPD